MVSKEMRRDVFPHQPGPGIMSGHIESLICSEVRTGAREQYARTIPGLFTYRQSIRE